MYEELLSVLKQLYLEKPYQSDWEFETIVAVLALSNSEGTDSCVVSPCGMCRELVSDYGEDIQVILPGKGDVFRKFGVMELLPD